MIENRRFYWMKTPIMSVACQNTGECPLTRIVESAGAEYRYMPDADGVKNVWFDYFPHKAQNIDDGAMVRNLIAACKQCHASKSR